MTTFNEINQMICNLNELKEDLFIEIVQKNSLYLEFEFIRRIWL